MKTIQVEGYISIGYANANRRQVFEVEVDEDLSIEEQEDQINEEVQQWANNFIEVSWNTL